MLASGTTSAFHLYLRPRRNAGARLVAVRAATVGGGDGGDLQVRWLLNDVPTPRYLLRARRAGEALELVAQRARVKDLKAVVHLRDAILANVYARGRTHR
jgi:hypothetical protein